MAWLEERIEACFAPLELQPDEIIDSTRGQGDPQGFRQAVLDFRTGARERLMETALIRGPGDPFTLAQLNSIPERLPHEYKLVEWARIKIAEHDSEEGRESIGVEETNLTEKENPNE